MRTGTGAMVRRACIIIVFWGAWTRAEREEGGKKASVSDRRGGGKRSALPTTEAAVYARVQLARGCATARSQPNDGAGRANERPRARAFGGAMVEESCSPRPPQQNAPTLLFLFHARTTGATPARLSERAILTERVVVLKRGEIDGLCGEAFWGGRAGFGGGPLSSARRARAGAPPGRAAAFFFFVGPRQSATKRSEAAD